MMPRERRQVDLLRGYKRVSIFEDKQEEKKTGSINLGLDNLM